MSTESQPISGTLNPDAIEHARYVRHWNVFASAFNSFCMRHGYTRPYFTERNRIANQIWQRLYPDSQYGRAAVTEPAAPSECPGGNLCACHDDQPPSAADIDVIARELVTLHLAATFTESQVAQHAGATGIAARANELLAELAQQFQATGHPA